MNRIIFVSALVLTALLAGAFILASRPRPRTDYLAHAGPLMSLRAAPPQTANLDILGLLAPKADKPKLAEHAKATRGKAHPPRPKHAHKRPGNNQHRPDEKLKKMPVQAGNKKTIPSPKPQTSGARKISDDPNDDGDLPRYLTEDIIEAFDKDPSKYFIRELSERENIVLKLIALENLDRVFVLKIAVDNKSRTDFFVKDFTARSGKRTLGVRSLFRVLVEAGKTSAGYLLIQKPQGGKPKKDAPIEITLREEGGERRSLRISIGEPL